MMKAPSALLMHRERADAIAKSTPARKSNDEGAWLMAFHDSWLGKRGTSTESNFMGIQNKIIRVIPYTDFKVEVFWGGAMADRRDGGVGG